VLSTCLRTELYAVVERSTRGGRPPGFSGHQRGHDGRGHRRAPERAVRRRRDRPPVRDRRRSAVVGARGDRSPRQVRRAAERAEAERAAGPVLSGLFQRAVKAGRKVRSSTAIARGATSLSHVAVDLATARLGGSLAGRRVLVVGAGRWVRASSTRWPEQRGNRGGGRDRGGQPHRRAGPGSGRSGRWRRRRHGRTRRGARGGDAVLLSTGSSLPVLDVEKMTSVAAAGQMRLGQMRLGQMRLGPMRCAALWSSSM